MRPPSSILRLLAALLLVATGVLGVRLAQRPSAEAVAPSARVLAKPADPERPGAVAGDALVLEAIEEERRIPAAGGDAVEVRRLARLVAEPGRLVRIVDRLERAPAGGGWRLAGREIMRPDSVVVAATGDLPLAGLRARIEELGYAIAPGSPGDAVLTVLLPEATLDAVPAALARIAAALPAARAEPNFVLFPFRVTPSDYDAASLWGLERVEAPGAWAFATGSPDIVVAVLDTGVDRAHPDLVGNLFVNTAEIAGNGIDDDGNGFVDDVQGWNFADGGNAQSDDTDGHGSHVAGTIGARGDNALGVVGVNWRVRILPIRLGGRTFDNANAINGLRYVIGLRQRGVNLVAVNASFGGPSMSSLFRDEIARAGAAGILFVAAAGNDGASNDQLPVYPASYDGDTILAVASTHQGDSLSDFSNFGRVSVDLAAPGSGVRSTVRGGGYDHFDGTSMAAPHVAGAAALLAAREPALTPAQIRSRILGTVDPVPALADRVASGGRLNIRRAVAPTTVAPRVRIVAPDAEVVALPAPGAPLSVTALVVGEGGAIPEASISWEIVSGPPGATLAPEGVSGISAQFSSSGLHRLRVRATSGPLSETDEIVVVVGAPDAPTGGLVGWWALDETGGPALDSSGANRTGAVTAITRTTGVFGGAARFDGSASNIAFAAPALPRLSYAGWVRADTAGNSIFPRVVHLRSGLLFLGLQGGAGAVDGNRGTLKFALDDGVEGRVWYSRPGLVSTGRWMHVAVSYDNTAANPTPVLYLDGRPQTALVQSGGAAGPPSVAAGAGFLGDRGDATRVLNGVLDDVRLYDRQLSAAEVAVLGREPALRAFAGATLVATPAIRPLEARVEIVPGAAGVPLGPVTSVVWNATGPGAATFSAVSGPGAVITVTEPGTYQVRQDVTTADGVAVVRFDALELPLPVVATPGHYSGGAFTFVVDAAGVGTFFGSGAQGIFGESISVAFNGAFSFVTRRGVTVTGRIDPAGGVAGVFSDGTTFAGARLSGVSSATDAARDGRYRGWIVDSGTRIQGLVTGGRLAVAIEDAGPVTAFSSDYDATGTFATGVQTTIFDGSIAGGVIDGFVRTAGGETRRFVLFRPGVAPDSRLVNLSMRTRAAQGDEVAIAGFVTTPGAPFTVLVRGAGPALGAFGVGGVLADPRVVLRTPQSVIGENTGWETAADPAALAAAAQAVGAFPFAAGARDSAVLATVSGGNHMAEVLGAGGGSGLALAEIYALDGGGSMRLLNLSARSRVGEGDAVMIGGFVVAGTHPALVLVRGVGPGLTGFGVPGALARPELTVLRGAVPLASARAWGAAPDAGLVAEASRQFGAFDLGTDSQDASFLLFLPAGAYTAQLRGVDGTTGIAIVEIYEVGGF